MSKKDLSRLGKDLKRALDKTLAETVITIQAGLQSAAVSPTDTSRFRSNWFVAEGSADRTTTEATTPNPNAEGLTITSDKKYFITNSLPYSEKLAIEGEGQSVINKPRTWFTSFRNQRIPEIVKQAVETVKAEEAL